LLFPLQVQVQVQVQEQVPRTSSLSSLHYDRKGGIVFQQRKEQQQQQQNDDDDDDVNDHNGKNKNNQQLSSNSAFAASTSNANSHDENSIDIANTSENSAKNKNTTSVFIASNTSTNETFSNGNDNDTAINTKSAGTTIHSFSSIIKKVQQNIRNPVPLSSPPSSSTSSPSSSTSLIFGKKGELIIFIEIILVYSILRGYVPIFHHLMQFVFGPILFLTGIIITILGCRELNQFQSFTPLTKPIPMTKGGDIVTSNIYSYIRHPVYAGNIYSLIGLSIITESSSRFVLSLVYYLLVDQKSHAEEENMESVYGVDVYQLYKNRVKGKFLPSMDRLFPKKKEMDQINANELDGNNTTVITGTLDGDSDNNNNDDDKNSNGFDMKGSRGFLFP